VSHRVGAWLRLADEKIGAWVVGVSHGAGTVLGRPARDISHRVGAWHRLVPSRGGAWLGSGRTMLGRPARGQGTLERLQGFTL
jgi:hypothetical protein